MICLPEIKTAELSTYGNFAECHQAHFRVSRVGLGTRLHRTHLQIERWRDLGSREHADPKEMCSTRD